MCVQKLQYEEAVVQLKEANQVQQRLQELDERTTQEINIEVWYTSVHRTIAEWNEEV